VARIFEDAQCVTIARRCAANLENDVFVAVIIQVRERNCMSPMPFSGAGRSRDIHEQLPALVVKQHARLFRDIGGGPSTKKDVGESIIIYVAKVGAHRHLNLVETNFLSNVTKSAVTQILIEFQCCRVMREAQISAGGFIQRKKITGCENVW